MFKIQMTEWNVYTYSTTLFVVVKILLYRGDYIAARALSVVVIDMIQLPSANLHEYNMAIWP
jgi:hypothetical protein